MMGLGKPQLHPKFEVASLNHCVNIEGKPPNFGGAPLGTCLLLVDVIFTGLGKPQPQAKFKVASLSVEL